METRQSDHKLAFQLRLVNFLFGMASATIGFYVLFLKTQGMNPTTVGIVMGFNALLGVVSPPFWGMLADRIQSKYRVFVYTALGTAVISVLIPVSAVVSIGGVMLATVTVPLMNFFREPSIATLDTASVTASTMVQGVEYSNVRCWLSIGYTVMSFAYSPLVNVFGASFPFYAFVFFTALFILYRKTLLPYDEKPKTDEPTKEKLQVSRLFKDYYLMVFLIIEILMMVPQNTSRMLPYLLSDLGLNASLIGTLSGIRVCGEITMLLISSRLRRMMPRPLMMSMAVVCALIEQVLYQVSGGFFGVAIGALFGGACFGLTLSTGYDYVHELAPQGLKTTAISLYSIGNPLAGTIVSFLGGAIISNQGIRMLFVYTEICMVLWLILFLGSFLFGEKVLKKAPPTPLFRRV